MEPRDAHQGWPVDDYGRDSAPPADLSDAIDLRGLWFAFRRRFGLFVAVAGVVFTFAVVFIYQLPATFQPSVQVLIDPRTRDYFPQTNVLSSLTPDDVIVQTEVEVMSSRSLAERVVDDLGLVNDPEFNAMLNPPSGLDALIISVKRRISGVFRLLAPAPSAETLPTVVESDAERAERGRQLAISALQRQTSVRRVDGTYVITIEAVSTDPDKAADIANGLADEYLVDQLESKLAANRRAIEWLVERLAEMSQEVADAEAAVEVYRSQEGLTEFQDTTLTEQRIAQLNSELIIQRADLSERDARLRTANQAERTSILNFPDVLASPLIQTLRSQRADVIRQQGDLSTTRGPLHPDMVAINQQLADIDNEIENEVDRIIASLRTDANVARARVNALEEQVEELRTELEADNVSLIRLRQLQSEAEAKRQLYDSYFQRRQTLSESEFLQEPDARVISDAQPPLWPQSPNRQMLVIVAVAFALGCGAASIFMIEALDSGLRTTRDVENFLSKRCLGTLPKVSSGMLRRETVASVAARVVDKPFSAYAEAVRSLRASLLLSAERRGARSVMITSAMQGEGKSSLAFSLARMSAMMQVKTIIVDADTRRRQLTLAASAAANPGLLNVFEGSAELSDVVIKDTKTDLDILPAGRITEGPGELFSLGKLEYVLQQLGQIYDFIVVDSTPLLAVAEGREIATIVDTVLLAARWRKSPRATVKAALKVLDSVDAPLAGVALTQANMRLRALYAGEGAYQAEYGSYYQE